MVVKFLVGGGELEMNYVILIRRKFIVKAGGNIVPTHFLLDLFTSKFLIFNTV